MSTAAHSRTYRRRQKLSLVPLVLDVPLAEARRLWIARDPSLADMPAKFIDARIQADLQRLVLALLASRHDVMGTVLTDYLDWLASQ
jgi:hypothetical protein